MNMPMEHYLAMSPREFPYLRRFTLREAERGGSPDIQLELVFRGLEPGSLVVTCAGVQGLVFRQPFTSDMKLHALDVRDASSAQLENIRFEVCDIEEEALSFQCLT